MATKYQVTELDRALEQFKGIDEWTNEQQLEWKLKRSEESAIKELQRMAEEKAKLYTDNVLLKREVEELKKPNHYEMGNELLMRDIKVLKTKVKKGKDLISKLQSELTEYRNLKSECHKDIEKVWMYDADGNLDRDDILKRDYLIEKVFYTIANQWID